MKFIYSFFLIAITFLGVKEENNLNYIRLDYAGGPVDKPIPTVVFSVEKYEKSYDFIGSVYYVSKCELLSIKEVIEEERFSHVIDTTDVGYYNFLIVAGGKKKLYVSDDKKNTAALFDRITSQLERKSEKSRF